ncbi:MAG: hypothetical protein J5871_06685 [Bacteroidales bacterium]|nr:hypothetical protein [Bacteroidales bacterium]
MKKQILTGSYAAPASEIVEMSVFDAVLADSYYSGGGGSYTDEDIVDNGNY